MLSIVLQAWRSWKSAKALGLLAAVALAVGIGSATAIYTVVNAVMLKPLPYQDGDRFVALYGTRSSEPGEKSALSYADLFDYQHRTGSFDVFGWYTPGSFNLTAPGRPQYVEGLEVTPSLVDNLGVNPALGRWFRESDGIYTVVLSNGLWKRLGADPGIVGKALTLNSRKYTVTGVAPAWFLLPVSVGNGRGDLWAPIDPSGKEKNRGYSDYFCYARRKPGVTFDQAASDVKRVAAGLAREHPENVGSNDAKLESLRDVVSEDVKPALLLLSAAAGLLLLITCANVAGLLVARSVARARETAVRVAIGASPSQLALQYFAEGLAVALGGATAGVLLSFTLVRIVVAAAGDYIPRSEEVGLDWTVLFFAFGTAGCASVLASFAPLWQALRTAPNEVLGDGARTSAGARSRRLSQGLVVAEIALAFTLQAAGATLVAQVTNLLRVSPGLDPEHVLTFELTAAGSRYDNATKLAAYEKRLTEAMKALPGVENAAVVSHLPLTGCCYSTTLFPEGRVVDARAIQKVVFQVASEEYFRTMRIPLLEGRFLNERDSTENPVHALINQAAARYYWPDGKAVGAYTRISARDGDRVQVVGIVGNVRNDGLTKPTVPEIYFSYTVAPLNPMYVVVRSQSLVKTFPADVRRAVQSVDPGQPIHSVETMNEIVQRSVLLERVTSFMTAFFAFAALLMATLGVYGVVAYSVRQRTVEMGTRLALGAVSRDLFRLVIVGGLRMSAYGIVIGAAVGGIALWLLVRTSVLRQADPVSLLYATVIAVAVAALASFFPAWRITLLSPMVAIRNEPGTMWQTARQIFGQVAEEREDWSGGTLLTEFVDATRHAQSFPEALAAAISTLREKMGAESATLIENTGSGEFAPDGFLMNRLKFYPFPFAVNAGDIETWQRWADEQKPQFAAEIESFRRTGARMAVPLRTKKETLGVLLLGAKTNGSEYTAGDKRTLRTCADQLALMLENARLTGRVVTQERLRRDVALAAEVQRRLLPDKSPETALGDFAASSLPARTVGGDYYDFLEAGEHRIGIAIADVAGKGVAAALIMSVLQASLRIISADEKLSLPELAAKMNRYLHRSTGTSSYATFFYAQWDQQSHQLRYVNAGHNPPFLFRSSNGNSIAEIEELSAGGMIIGMFPHARYEETTVDLRSGDVLLAFTDGVTEALNPSEEEFGEDRLKTLLREVAHLPAKEMSARISAQLKDWIADADQYDDLTFVVMKVK